MIAPTALTERQGAAASHDETLPALEKLAVRLVRLGGALILSALEKPGEVRFKAGAGATRNFSPASDVDRSVELMIRDEIKRHYPTHGIIGEEQEEAPDEPNEYVWIIDPLDGTSNFLNGYPLFASTIGVVRNGQPVVGATWCATTHALTPGVYHAHDGSGLCFEHSAMTRRRSAAWRGLAGEPGRSPAYGRDFDTRVLGSAATECALLAAGVLRIAFIDRPRIWDVAAGLVLAREAGCTTLVSERRGDAWEEFATFDAGTPRALRGWRARLLMGERADVELALQQRNE